MPYSDKPQDILRQIASTQPPLQVYMLAGEEEYFTDKIEKKIVSSYLGENMKEFNYTLLYGPETSTEQIITACRRVPIGAERTVVVVREAQDLLRGGESNMNGLAGLEQLLLRPNPMNILVLSFKQKKPDRRLSFVKKVEEVGLYIEAKEVRDYQIDSYIPPLAREYGLSLTPDSVKTIAEHVGTDIIRLDSELEKLGTALTDQEKTKVTPEMVLHYTGLNKEYSAFDLRKALAQKDKGQAMKIALMLAEDAKRVPVQMIIPVLFDFFSNLLIALYARDKSQQGIMNELEMRAPFMVRDFMAALRNYKAYKVAQIITYLRRADARSKGMYSDEGSPEEILIDMTLFILN